MSKINPLIPKLGMLLIVIQLLFLGNLSYLYGSVFKMSERIYRFDMLAVNFDDGVVAESLIAAYDEIKSPGFPTVHFVNSTQFNSAADVAQQVINGNYWAAIYTNANASNRLVDAIDNGGSAAESYNASHAITYVWNEVRYPAISDQLIEGNLNILVAATRLAFNNIYGSTGLKTLKEGDENALQVFLNPISSTSDNIQPTGQGVRLFLNTVSVAMMILQQFFLVLGPNMMLLAMGVYKKYSWERLFAIRMVFAIASSFFSGLTTAGYYWAFRETWTVNGNQFVLTWITLWLATAIYHIFLYAVSCILPLPFVPLVLITFIFFNITSTITPFDANPGFYRIGYAFPAYNAYSILTDIWSGGRVAVLYRALPILFSWLIVVVVFAFFAHRLMCLKLRNAQPPSAPVQEKRPVEDEDC